MNVFDLVAKIFLDTSDYDDGIDGTEKSSEGLASKLKSGLGKAGKIAAAGIAAVGAAAIGALAGLNGIAEATEEYRIAQGKLKTAFEAAGYDVGLAQQSYTEFYKILGDTDTATEASQLLAKLADNAEDVSVWTNIAAGVSGTFGDSLPIEGLIESANETAKVGQITGSLADALNWAGISEDEFNKKLAACTTESQRNELIMNTLSGTYEQASEAFYRNSESIVAARENQAKMDATLASLGQTVSDVKNKITAEFLPSISSVVSAFNGLLTGASGAEASLASAIGSLVSTAVAKIPEFLTFGANILTAIVGGIFQSIPVLISGAAEIVSYLGTAIMNGIPQLANAAVSMMTNFGNYLRENLPTLIQTGLEAVVKFTESIRSNAGLVIDGAIGLAKSLAQGLADSIPTIIQNVPTIVSNIANTINDNAPKILSAAINIIVTLVSGLIQAIPTIIQNIPKIIMAIVNALLAFNWINLGSSIVKGIGSGLKSMISFVKDIGSQIVNSIKGGFAALPGQMLTIGRNIVQGLWNGIVAMKDWVIGKVREFAGGIVSGIKNFLGIQSPSTLFRDEVGKYIALGVAVGIDENASEAEKAAEKMAQNVYSKSVEWIDRNTKYQEFSLKEQLEVWQTIQGQFLKESKQYADAEEKIFDLKKKVEDEHYANSVENIERQVKYQGISLREQLSAWDSIQSQFSKKSKQYAEAEGKIFDIRKKLQEDFFARVKELNENTSKVEEEYQTSLANRTKQIFDSYNLFDELPKKQEVSGQSLIDNLKAQIASTESFYSGLDELTNRGVGDGLVEQIREMGPKAIDYLDAILSMSDDKLSEYATLYKTKQTQANDLAVEELADLKLKTDKQVKENLSALEKLYGENVPVIGKLFSEGLSKGILDGIPKVIEAASRAARSAMDASQKEFSGIRKGVESAKNTAKSSIDFASSGIGASSAQIINSFSASSAASAGVSTLNLMLPDGKKFATYYLPSFADMAKANGTPIINPT